MRKVIEGIFDICKKEIPGDFGKEFGDAFERYVHQLLKFFIPAAQIFNEKQLRRYTDKKICDYMLVFEDHIFLIECKAIEYSAYVSSENALKGDNSTKKIQTDRYYTAFFNRLNDQRKCIP
ncbi:hypothetical protein [Aneurinibacillus sp. REN35]|uniref:hypothetical protein n=1 Tax=Aneurinibacillus sp. REN35 TaxID=3237286 RepID=UPI003527052C